MYKVILIDDEPLVIKDICELIDWESSGYRIVASTTNSIEAKTLMKIHKPDMIISDIRMPGINGLDLLELMNRRLPDTLMVFISAYSDFSYARQSVALGAFDYLVKPIEPDNLVDTLKRAHKRISEIKQLKRNLREYKRTGCFINILESKNNSTFILKKLAQCGFVPKHKLFRVAIVKDVHRPVLKNILSISTAMGHNRWLYLINYDSRMENLCCSSKNLLKYLKKSKAVTGISTSFNDIRSFNEAYRQADIMADSDFVKGKHGVFAYTHKKPAPTRDLLHKARQIKDLNTLNNCIKALKAVIDTDNVDIECFTWVFNHCLDFIYSQDEDRNTFELDHINYKELLQLYRNAHDAIDYMEAMVCRYHPLQINTRNNLIKEIAGYLNEHYSERLMLSDIADKYFVNLSYLSRLFKKEIGKSFSSYLVQIRLDKAAQLLEDTDMKLCEISSAVGYDDYYHFSKIFKKYKGTNPYTYRKRNT